MSLRVLSIFSTVTIGLAAPSAGAQIVGPPPSGAGDPPSVTQRMEPARDSAGSDLEQARKTIRAGRDSGRLSRREAKALRKQAAQIGDLQERYGRDGLSPSESRELDMRSRALESLAGAPGRGPRR